MYTPVTDTCQEMSQGLFLRSECIHQHVRPGEDLPGSRLFMKLSDNLSSSSSKTPSNQFLLVNWSKPEEPYAIF